MSEPVTPHFTRAELEAVLERFRGTILQTPPPFSAKKVAGTPAYRLARKHIAVELEPVEVRVFALRSRWNSMEPRPAFACAARPELISAVSRTMWAANSAAEHFLTALRRTASGEFSEATRVLWKRWKSWRARAH